MEEVTVVELKPQAVLGTRKKGRYTDIPAMLGALCGYPGAMPAFSGPPVFVCHESSPEEVEKANKEGTADVEVAIPVSKKIKGSKEIKNYELPGGKMAKIVHKGPYAKCGPAYEKLFAWIAKNKKKLAGPTREVYLNDPREVSEMDLLTEIYAPIG
ncbi:MAG: GyrI-like domain-containing protein [Candidatus Altiarchaeia archaeon]